MTRSQQRRNRRIAVMAGVLVAVLAVASSLFFFVFKGDSAQAQLPEKIRIGYFANVTHGSALVALQQQLFEKNLPGVTIEYAIFPAGPAAIEAFKGGALDISYIGPNPAISGYATTNGELLRIVSGATSGGAQFVVRPGVTASNLKGKNFATPQLGNTQDVALKDYLTSKGLTFGQGGDVAITPTENATTLTLFQQGKIDGAWVPEPWASRLVLEGNGTVLVNEADLWQNGDFITTNIAASSTFIDKYPAAVKAVLAANLEANAFIAAQPEAAKALVQTQLKKDTGKSLSTAVIDRAWKNLVFTHQPLASTLQKNADGAVAAGVLKLSSTGLKGIYNLAPLNEVLKSKGLATVSSAGLGKE
jgi:NitT/TauT family transport system substrate-binding protein